MSMNMDSFRPLQEYLDSIPEPKWWQFGTRFVIWWSNLIDDITIWKWNRKKSVQKEDLQMITDPWLLDPVCACCKNMTWAAEQDMLFRDCEKCKNYRESKENSRDIDQSVL